MADRSSWFEIAKEVFLDVLVFSGLAKKSEAGKAQPDQEKIQKVFCVLAPHVFGIGLNDESSFNAALAKLDDRRQVKISRFMETASDHDRARFILAVTSLPDEKDRIGILNMYSELLSTAEMTSVATATRMITGGDGLMRAISRTAMATALAINDAASAEAAIQEQTWFGRMSRALFR